MEQLGLMERFSDPALFESLTTAEKAIGGFVTTLMGMGTTFVILFLLWGIIAFISRLIQKSEHLPSSAVVAQPAGVSAKEESSLIDPELIAVIAAAITACGVKFELRGVKVTRVKQNQNKNKWIKPTAGATFAVDGTNITGVRD